MIAARPHPMSNGRNGRRGRRRQRQAGSAPRFRLFAPILVAALLLLPGGIITGPPALAAGARGGTPWVVSLGDSYISGEAGRWAGNTNRSPKRIDALGPTAYDDNEDGTAEQIPRCHRSRSAEVHIDTGVGSLNLACSGARTSTFIDSSGDFKPGLDFYHDALGREGQAQMLQDFAATHDVRLIAISIGGNNYNFGSIVQTCLEDFLTSSSLAPHYCQNDASVTANLSPDNVRAQTNAIESAIRNVRQAMAGDGYAASAYTVLVQTYPSPIPNGSGFRYAEGGFGRQVIGGCGFWSADADWANAAVLPIVSGSIAAAAARVSAPVLDLSTALDGRRLCESTVGLLEERGVARWTDPGAVDRTEWVDQIRTVSALLSGYFVQESLHPNYWGQLALRSCLRQAYNGGRPRGGTCTIAGTGLSDRLEPVMRLVPRS
ncbi:MAG: hypothetical protein QOG45_1275 [Chloroflexota bacterium]|nr:hypothetical protein [Chloroflexota bacterium]